MQKAMTHSQSKSDSADLSWERLESYVLNQRRLGQLILMPIVIASYPDRDGCRRYVDCLLEAGVQLVELVNPIREGWSSSTNEVIRNAHRVAFSECSSNEGSEIAHRFVGSLNVIYEGSVNGDLREYSLEQLQRYSILQFAFASPLLSTVRDLRQTTMVGVSDPTTVLERVIKSARWMLVCKLTDRTGGKVIDLERTIDHLLFIRSMTDLPLFCTFGVSDPSIIGRLRSSRACDGVIVGTVLLEQLHTGITSAREIVRQLQMAAMA